MERNIYKIGKELFITNDEEKKDGDCVLINSEIVLKNIKATEIEMYQDNSKKIILTTDQDLIKNDVQAIDDEFLEWFVKNPTCEEVETKLIEQRSHLTLNDWVDKDENGKFPISIAGVFCYRKIYKIIIPKEDPKRKIDTCYNFNNEIGCVQADCRCEKEEPKQELCPICETNVLIDGVCKECTKKLCKTFKPKQETLEEAMIKNGYHDKESDDLWREGVEFGAKWQTERSYSEEEVKKIVNYIMIQANEIEFGSLRKFIEFQFEQFKNR